MKTIKLNNEVLQNLYGDCEESKGEVFSEFISTYSEMKQKLFLAYDSGDMDTLKSLLHLYGPSFMYLGVPDVSEFFKNLELECSGILNRNSFSVNFFKLLQMVDDTWLEVYNQTVYFKKAV